MQTTYIMPVHIEVPRDSVDVACNIGHFLLANGLPLRGRWRGKMQSEDQRRMFGNLIRCGRKTIILDGHEETVRTTFKGVLRGGEGPALRCKTGELLSV